MFEQIFTVLKEYFPATLGAILGAWNKRDGLSVNFSNVSVSSLSDKLFVTMVAVFAIIVGIALGKWVSVALVGYYALPSHAIPVIEFVTALNGIKLVDSAVKAVDKSLDILSEKVPKIVGSVLDSIGNKIKKWFE